MQVINTNIPSLNAMRASRMNQGQLATAIERLSSGLRINSAKDDAAGLAISTRMETQIRGMSQAARNINDAVSMMQTAEGALGSMVELFQRGRELAIQAANSTNSDSDRGALQAEIEQLVSEVDRISEDTEFNNIKLFDGGDTEVTYDPDSTGLTDDELRILDSLKRSWLEQSEAMVEQYLGIKAENIEIDIVFKSDTGAADAYVSYAPGPDGPLNMELVVNTESALAVMDAQGDWPNQPLDNLIAHEMTHAVMAATTNMGVTGNIMPKWFTEGMAELLPGGDFRLASVLSGGSTSADVINELNDIQGTSWDTTDIQYAASYVAVRMLHEEIKVAGYSDGVKDMMVWMAEDNTRTLDEAIDMFTAGTHTGADDFIDNYVQADTDANAGVQGVNFIDGVIGNLNLANNDGGGIGGLDADGGAERSFASAVPDIDNFNSDPLANFKENFPTGTREILLSSSNSFQFQVGSEVGETIDIELAGINTGNLGLSDIDISTNWDEAIIRFDAALNAVNKQRANFGAVQNRFESAANSMAVGVESTSASRSRIRDADFAAETAEFARFNILNQAQMAMISQANNLPRTVLNLLR